MSNKNTLLTPSLLLREFREVLIRHGVLVDLFDDTHCTLEEFNAKWQAFLADRDGDNAQ